MAFKCYIGLLIKRYHKIKIIKYMIFPLSNKQRIEKYCFHLYYKINTLLGYCQYKYHTSTSSEFY